MAMKENDWILDGIVNPDKNLDDFLISGYNTSNTQLLSKDENRSLFVNRLLLNVVVIIFERSCFACLS